MSFDAKMWTALTVISAAILIALITRQRELKVISRPTSMEPNRKTYTVVNFHDRWAGCSNLYSTSADLRFTIYNREVIIRGNVTAMEEP